MITPDFKFRQSVLSLLYELKAEMNGEFDEAIEYLKESMDELPENNFEQSVAFFTQITKFILSQLNGYYEIEHIRESDNTSHYDLFTLKLDDDVYEMTSLFSRYMSNARFHNSFLNGYDYNLWRKLRYNSFNRPFSSLYRNGDDENLLIKRNVMKESQVSYLPIDLNRHAYGTTAYTSLGTLYKQVRFEKAGIDTMRENYASLTKAVEAFNEKIRELVKQSSKKVGIMALKEMLSEIILPVELLMNEELKNKCIEEERMVFVNKPQVHHLLKVGMMVHVYAAPDLAEDSFIAKPVPANGVPKNIKGLCYLGNGNYTGYNESSPRSLNKVVPHIINENLFVKININDFIKELPKKIREEITNCENLLESMENKVKEIEINSNASYDQFIEGVQNLNVTSANKLIAYYLDSAALLRDTTTEAQLPSHDNSKYTFEDTNFSFNTDLVTWHYSGSYKFALLKDSHGGYAALKVEEGKRAQIYLSKDIDECCEALQLKTGLHSVYSFYKRDQHRAQAFLTFHKFTEKETE